MIFRAMFWIGLVAILMPHEPDLGFGRPQSLDPSIDTGVAGEVADWAKTKVAPNVADPSNLCRYNLDACTAGASLIDHFRAAAVRSLSDVKADIEQNAKPQPSGG